MARQRGRGDKAWRPGSAEGVADKASIMRSTHQTLSIALACAQAQVYAASINHAGCVVGRPFEVSSSVPVVLLLVDHKVSKAGS